MSCAVKLPRLVLITDWTLPRGELERVLEAVLPLGPSLALQHRHPGAEGRHFLEEAKWLQGLCRLHGNPLFINDRLDVARLLSTHLHLPAHSVDVAAARSHLPDGWVSAAVHNQAEAERAAGADFALVSPVFSPGSKPGDTRPSLGWEGFLRLARALPCPAFALGGLTPQNILIPAAGIAVMGAVWRSARPRETASLLLGGQTPAA